MAEATRVPKRVCCNKVFTAGGFAGGCQSQTMVFLVLLASASVGLPLCGAVVSDVVREIVVVRCTTDPSSHQ